MAERLASLELADPLVLAVPRGGVPVAAAVAEALRAPLEVFIVRKIALPRQPGFGVGAIAEGGEPLFAAGVLADRGLSRRELEQVVEDERRELARRLARYRGDRALPELSGRTVVLVDDGLATGVTATAALRALRAHRPRRLVLAVPVCAPATARRLGSEADEMVCVLQPEPFGAVAAWYERFDQTSDERVLEILAAAYLGQGRRRGARFGSGHAEQEGPG